MNPVKGQEGAEARDLGIIENAFLAASQGKVAACGRRLRFPNVELAGATVMTPAARWLPLVS